MELLVISFTMLCIKPFLEPTVFSSSATEASSPTACGKREAALDEGTIPGRYELRVLSARLISAFIVTYFLVFLNLSHHKNLSESKNIPPNLLVAAEVAVVLHLSSIEDLGGSREVFSTQPPSQGGYHGTTVASKTGPIRRVRGMARLEITGCNHLALGRNAGNKSDLAAWRVA